MNFSLSKGLCLAIATIGYTTASSAADISHSLRNNTEIHSEPEDYLELGLSAQVGKWPSFTELDDDEYFGLGVVVNGSYNWQGLFIDFFGESQTPLVIGYNAYNNANWSLDLVLTPTGNDVGADLDDRFAGIDERKNSLMLGGRATGYLAGNTVQLSVSHDVTNKHNGVSASALVGRNWQYRNWNVHGMIGLNYSNASFVDYYLGVSEQEAARTNFSVYNGKATLRFTTEVGVTYPLTENWVFRATSRYGSLVNQERDTPLLLNNRSDVVSLSTSISYVF